MQYTIKQARCLADKTQVEMASLLNVSRDTYRKYEKRPETIPATKALQIAKITKLNFGDILF